MRKSLTLLYLIVPLLQLTSCFTGVESTPRITQADVKKQNITVTPEMRYLADISTPNPKDWDKGRLFYITDDKINLVLVPDDRQDAPLSKGLYMAFEGVMPALAVTGEDVALVSFLSPAGKKYSYRSESSYADFAKKEDFDLPFAVDMVLVDSVKNRIEGKKFYITTPLWFDESGASQRRGLRHVEVQVTDVKPGDSNYPILVVFARPGSMEKSSVYMTVGEKRTSTRNFDTLFVLENPRLKYKNITDENWNLIVHSRVRPGMTKDECRLALGSPKVHGQRPTTAGMVEYWQYSDGTYLVFEEGYLAMIR